MDRKCELCGKRNSENCNTCPDMEVEPQVVQISGKAYPKNEFFWKSKNPRTWNALQELKEIVSVLTSGEVTVHFKYPEAKSPKIIYKPSNETNET